MSKKTLVIVESPAKSKTIEKFLGKNYTVAASMGHLRDLPKSQFGVDTDNNYEAKYINIRKKGDLIKELKAKAKKADRIFLATDPDREGEAIAWHLAFILGVSDNERCRVVFNEITKKAIQDAIKKPRKIDLNMVNAQQARRILDRMVGYKLSPLLWKKIHKGLSAGRVQSVALKLVCDREEEIKNFIPEEYWTIHTKLKTKTKGTKFNAELVKESNKKIKISSEKHAKELEQTLQKAKYIVKSVVKKERRRNPVPPYTTSSMQQDAVRKLGFTIKKTMMLAQQLYEGVALGSAGSVGLITYMRTDSVRISTTAQQEARLFIENKYGAKYLPAKAPVYSSKQSSQDAHEAIRPSDILKTPENMKEYLSRDLLRLYTMIWQRFTTSQMISALFDTTTVDIVADNLELRANGSVLKFDGFLIVYDKKDKNEQEDIKLLPELEKNQTLLLDSVLPPEQHFTEHPPRYTEASLVKKMEEKGIGRPSTYAPIINTIIERRYVEKEDKKFYPTELGVLVTKMLEEYFSNIVDVDFSAEMETELDHISEGKADKIAVLDSFYKPFAETLEKAEAQIGDIEIKPEVTDIKCDKCGRFMVVKYGRFGSFLACPGFPECRNAKPILKKIGIKCPLCSSEIVERKSKRCRIFYGCEKYPECSFVAWDKPTGKFCDECGSMLLEKSFKTKDPVIYCINDECKNAMKKAGKKISAKK